MPAHTLNLTLCRLHQKGADSCRQTSRVHAGKYSKCLWHGAETDLHGWWQAGHRHPVWTGWRSQHDACIVRCDLDWLVANVCQWSLWSLLPREVQSPCLDRAAVSAPCLCCQVRSRSTTLNVNQPNIQPLLSRWRQSPCCQCSANCSPFASAVVACCTLLVLIIKQQQTQLRPIGWKIKGFSKCTIDVFVSTLSHAGIASNKYLFLAIEVGFGSFTHQLHAVYLHAFAPFCLRWSA